MIPTDATRRKKSMYPEEYSLETEHNDPVTEIFQQGNNRCNYAAQTRDLQIVALYSCP